jgi:hypothetical protein
MNDIEIYLGTLYVVGTISVMLCVCKCITSLRPTTQTTNKYELSDETRAHIHAFNLTIEKKEMDERKQYATRTSTV